MDTASRRKTPSNETICLALSGQDEQSLQAFDRHRDLIRDYTESVARRHHVGAVVIGPPGTSKTVTVEETLRSLNVPWTMWNARVSPMGLWCTLREHPDSTIVLDDVSTLFASGNKQGLQVLLAALGGQPGKPRTVSYATKEDRIRFEFSGGIIAIGNELPKRAPMVDALISRTIVLKHDPTDEMIAAFMRSESRRGYKGLTPYECREVVEFVITESRTADFRLDLRNMKAAWETLRYSKTGSRHGWQNLVRSQLQTSIRMEPTVLSKAEELERDRRRVARLMNDLPNDTPKQIEASGLSKSTFYQRRKEVLAGL
jgi:hypothetical protein